MAQSSTLVRSAFLAMLVGFGGFAATSVPGHAETIPSATAIPVVFTTTLDSGKVKVGQIVSAKTTEVVLLPGGRSLPSGTTLMGHVAEATRFAFDPAPYAIQKPSTLSVHFDRILINGAAVPLSLSVRAIAGPVAFHEASILRFRNEGDSTGTRTLIGGNEITPFQRAVFSPDGNVIEYNRKLGMFAQLLAADYVSDGTTVRCGETKSEQSVGVFSPSACGVYGIDASMPDNGGNGDGTFIIESRSETVKLYANSAALLQVIKPAQ